MKIYIVFFIISNILIILFIKNFKRIVRWLKNL